MISLAQLSFLALLLPFSICVENASDEVGIQIGNGSAGGTSSPMEATTTTTFRSEMPTWTTDQPSTQVGNVEIGLVRNVTESEDPVVPPRPLGLGDSCEIYPSLCQTSLGEYCNSERKKCECLPLSHVPNSANKECLQLANKRGDPCNETSQCTPNIGGGSECVQGKCECLEGSSYWVKSLHYDRDRSRSGSCIKKGHVRIGDLCNKTGDCTGPPNTARCVFGRCFCQNKPEAYIVNRELTRCLPSVKKFGEECEESQQCHLGLDSTEFQCRQEEGGRRRKVCQCKADEDRLEYWGCQKKPTKLNDFCYNGMQCVTAFGPSECFNSRCKCHEGTTWNGERCVVNLD